MRPNILLISVLWLVFFLVGCDGNSNSSHNEDVVVTPTSDCLWAGGDIKKNEHLNFAMGDTNAAYWVAVYVLPEENAYVTFDHEFPHSRFISYNTYSAVLAWVDDLVDWEILPAASAINPFVEGNPRNNLSRQYQVTLKQGQRPEDSDPATENILYYGNTDNIDNAVVLIYRNYLPDDGQDITGGVGLPRVTLHMGDGSIIQGEEACDILNIGYEPTPILIPEDTYAALRETTDPAQNPPLVRATYDRSFQLRCEFEGDCSNPPQRGALILLNPDQVTSYSFVSRKYGEVLLFRGKIPLTSKTHSGDDVFMNGDLRYWAMCVNEYYATKVRDCLPDEKIEINSDGFYTIVISRAEDRPSNATEECGVGFMLWPEDGDGFGIVEGRENYSDDAYILVRNVLPSPGFNHSNHSTRVVGDEAEVLGEYLPRGQYFTKAEFEGLGCNPGPLVPYESMQQ